MLREGRWYGLRRAGTSLLEICGDEDACLWLEFGCLYNNKIGFIAVEIKQLGFRDL